MSILTVVPEEQPPKRCTVPPLLTSPNICSQISGKPTHSTATSSPRPSGVKPKIISLGSGYFFKSIISSASAKSFAALSFNGFLPMAITFAPFNFARRANISPIGPIPTIPTVSPDFIGVLPIPCATFASGSQKAAFLNDKLSGILIKFFSTMSLGIVIYCAYAPFKRYKFSHKFSSPRRQKKHSPQGAEFAATTRSPTLKFSTPSPILKTVPENSCPKPDGTSLIKSGCPRRKVFTSVPQVKAASTLTTTSPSAGSFTFTSSYLISRGA